MRLADLEPRWFSAAGDLRHGFTFLCPHCPQTGQRLAVATHVDGTNFDPEPDNPQCFATGETVWNIVGGDSFENITLTPSVDASKYGHWHGHIHNGGIS